MYSSHPASRASARKAASVWPYAPRGLQAVKAREAAVHQYQVGPCALREAKGLLTVCGLYHRVALNLQHGTEQEPRIIVVFRDEDERPRWPRSLCAL
jgi:hypothetical protein